MVRAVAGLAATVLDEARKLPETLPGLPVRLIGQALQTSLRLQQQYSGLVARGDEVFTGLRGDDEPGMATFDDDLPAPARPAGTPAPRSSAFDRVADLPDDAVDEELADELADDLAVADLPLADADALSEEAAAVLTLSAEEDGDLTPTQVADLPADPPADTLTAVVDELADEVADEVAEEMPDAVPDEVLADVTADAVAELAEEEAAVDQAVAEELIADAAVGGTPPATDAVPTLDDVTPDAAPEQTELVDDATPDLAALEDAAEELVDLGGPEAAESVTPGSDVTDSAASDPLVAPDAPAADDDAPAAPAAEAGPTSPVEGYDSFSIPALRGRLRGYPAETVADLLDYERATRARAPYVTLLQNRLEKLSIDRG
ncbi:hypothetical protein DMO24_13910 [Modestobacter versicolor]|uniref:Lipid droplet-associated protein n=1 Tax=Modestobacter versicolor TaxID=429133 RepID=A0A323V7F8_9ACTN|nr:hypothetical protein DMO24_13910 [Modestobacter versicolor]